jgi:hypothetical protein
MRSADLKESRRESRSMHSLLSHRIAHYFFILTCQTSKAVKLPQTHSCRNNLTAESPQERIRQARERLVFENTRDAGRIRNTPSFSKQRLELQVVKVQRRASHQWISPQILLGLRVDKGCFKLRIYFQVETFDVKICCQA